MSDTLDIGGAPVTIGGDTIDFGIPGDLRVAEQSGYTPAILDRMTLAEQSGYVSVISPGLNVAEQTVYAVVLVLVGGNRRRQYYIMGG